LFKCEVSGGVFHARTIVCKRGEVNLVVFLFSDLDFRRQFPAENDLEVNPNPKKEQV